MPMLMVRVLTPNGGEGLTAFSAMNGLDDLRGAFCSPIRVLIAEKNVTQAGLSQEAYKAT